MPCTKNVESVGGESSGTNPYGDKKAYISQSDFYGSKMKLLYEFAQLRASIMQTRHIRTLLAHAVSFAKPFMVFDCLYVTGIF